MEILIKSIMNMNFALFSDTFHCFTVEFHKAYISAQKLKIAMNYVASSEDCDGSGKKEFIVC